MARDRASVKSAVPMTEIPPVSEETKDGSQPVGLSVPRDVPEGEALYWFGALPAKGKQVILMQPAEGQPPNFERDDGHVEVTITAEEAWSPRFKGQPPIWLGRCPWYQNLGASGIEFVAFTEERVREAVNESRSFLMAWPGKVAKFSDSQLRVILESVRNHAIRITNESEEGDRKTKAYIVNYLHGHMPAYGDIPACRGPLRGCTCKEIERILPANERLHRKVSPEYRQRGDLPIADYVYLVRLSEDPSACDRKLYYRLAPPMEQFFRNPPVPLSEDLAKLEVAKEAAPADTAASAVAQ